MKLLLAIIALISIVKITSLKRAFTKRPNIMRVLDNPLNKLSGVGKVFEVKDNLAERKEAKGSLTGYSSDAFKSVKKSNSGFNFGALLTPAPAPVLAPVPAAPKPVRASTPQKTVIKTAPAPVPAKVVVKAAAATPKASSNPLFSFFSPSTSPSISPATVKAPAPAPAPARAIKSPVAPLTPISKTVSVVSTSTASPVADYFYDLTYGSGAAQRRNARAGLTPDPSPVRAPVAAPQSKPAISFNFGGNFGPKPPISASAAAGPVKNTKAVLTAAPAAVKILTASAVRAITGEPFM